MSNVRKEEGHKPAPKAYKKTRDEESRSRACSCEKELCKTLGINKPRMTGK